MIKIKHFEESGRNYHVCFDFTLYEKSSDTFEDLLSMMPDDFPSENLISMIEVQPHEVGGESFFIDVFNTDEVYIHDSAGELILNIQPELEADHVLN